MNNYPRRPVATEWYNDGAFLFAIICVLTFMVAVTALSKGLIG